MQKKKKIKKRRKDPLLTGNKNIIFIIFIILGFSFTAQNSYSQNISEEFAKDKESAKAKALIMCSKKYDLQLQCLRGKFEGC